MEHKFGVFDSTEELNRAAAAQKAEGDLEALIALALENGLEKEDAEDYMNGDIDKLATSFIAAFGKLKVETKYLQIEGVLCDWKDIIVSLCEENEDMQAAVMRKTKSLKECMAQLIRFSFENKVQVSEEIVKATKVTHNGREEPLRGPLYLGIPNRAEVKKIAMKYYLGNEVVPMAEGSRT